MKRATTDGMEKSLSMKSLWSIEVDFYIDDNSAIISLLHYSRIIDNISIKSTLSTSQPPWVIDKYIESLSFESGFRYHPIVTFNPLFVQASIGVIRMNPVYEYTYPKYTYKALDEITLGFIFPVTNLGFVLIPKVGLRTIFMETNPYSSRLCGYNQFKIGLNIGYEL